MKRSLVVVLAAICLDAVGVGLIFPILPRLLEDVTHARNVAPYIGITTALYAVMQFIFAPVLGALSDNVGRRSVLLVSLGGAAINYALMGFATELWMLLLGRAIAGLTSANVAVATAYITDISREDQRARRFGLLNAMFGIGFIIGPVLGGVLGDYGLRLPFLAAAVLNAGNLMLAWFVLPESRTPTRRAIDLAVVNPLRPLRWVFSRKDLVPITLVFFILGAAGEVYGTCWALGARTRFIGMVDGLVCRSARLGYARSSCRRSCPAWRREGSGSAARSSAEWHAPASPSSSWPSRIEAGSCSPSCPSSHSAASARRRSRRGPPARWTLVCKVSFRACSPRP